MDESLDAIGIAWRLGTTLFFVFVNGFFVAAEFALVKVRGGRLETLVSEGRHGARTLQHLHRNLDRYLSACQLGITLASLILGALGEPAVSVLLIAALSAGGVTLSANATWPPIASITLAFAIITTLHMTIGEQAPKMWAIRRAEGMAIATAPTLRAFAWIFAPFIAAINHISNWLLRMIGLPKESHHDEVHDAEEIRSILSLSAGAGRISEREYEITENVFRLTQLEVRHILVPRPQVEMLSLEQSVEENLRKVRESGHTRFPVCAVGLDTIVGFIHGKDLLTKFLDQEAVNICELVREPFFVPDTMSVLAFLSELQLRQAQCAAVVDERGTVVGFAFREDVLEEVVGQLGDEFDDPAGEMEEIGEGKFEAPGHISLPEALDRLGISLSAEEREDEDTLGGQVSAQLGRLAKTGDVVQMGPYRVEVVEASPIRIERLRLERATAENLSAKADDSQ